MRPSNAWTGLWVVYRFHTCDPDTFAERFELVISEESTLSYRQIHETLGRWPQPIWSVFDVDPYGPRKLNPVVYVPK